VTIDGDFKLYCRKRPYLGPRDSSCQRSDAVMRGAIQISEPYYHSESSVTFSFNRCPLDSRYQGWFGNYAFGAGMQRHHLSGAVLGS